MMSQIRTIDHKVKTAACLLNFRSNLPYFLEQDQSLRGHATPIPRPPNDNFNGNGGGIYIPPSLDMDTQRRLSLNLGNGACKWEPPIYDVPDDTPFYKTLIAGFPSCDKRMTFTQMEALTGWPARDEWDFVFYGPTNHPFIKSNYPHHEGYWSWADRADQVVMVVRNMRRTMVEYHDILWDIATAKKNSNLSYLDVLYRYRPPMESFLKWRDLRVMDEIHWYGWFIDYWMEGGLQRDIFSHELTTPQAWPYFPEVPPTPVCASDPWHKHETNPNTCSNNGIYTPPTPPPTRSPTPAPTLSPTTLSPTTNSTNYTEPVFTPPPVPPTAVPDQPHVPQQFLFASAGECCAASFPGEPCYLVDVCPTPAPTPPIQPSYDEHCTPGAGEITNGCEPVAVISAEKLRDLSEGPAETLAIANVLTSRPGISEYLIEAEAWNCIWEELIPNGKGNRMVNDRVAFGTETYTEADYGFSSEMLQAMLDEYDRLITKYTASPWNSKSTGIRLVQLLMEHRNIIQLEKNDVDGGQRLLTDRDFLGPIERERRRKLKAQAEGLSGEDAEQPLEEKKKHFEYFMALEEKVKTTRRADRARQRQEERLAAKKKKWEQEGHY